MDEDRIIYLLHGTTRTLANLILAKKAFDPQETYFAFDLDLAQFFAQRACSRRSSAESPVVVKIPLYEEDILMWKSNHHVLYTGFDEADDPYLRGKIQVVFNSEAVRLLNTYSFTDDWVTI